MGLFCFKIMAKYFALPVARELHQCCQGNGNLAQTLTRPLVFHHQLQVILAQGGLFYIEIDERNICFEFRINFSNAPGYFLPSLCDFKLQAIGSITIGLGFDNYPNDLILLLTLFFQRGVY